MKSRRFNMPVNIRVIIFIIGLCSTLLPFDAIRTGKIGTSTLGSRVEITQSQEPVTFWILVVILLFFSALMILGAFVKGKTMPN